MSEGKKDQKKEPEKKPVRDFDDSAGRVQSPAAKK